MQEDRDRGRVGGASPVGEPDEVFRIEVRPARRRPPLRKMLKWTLPIAAIIVLYFSWPQEMDFAQELPVGAPSGVPRSDAGLVPSGALENAPSRFEWPPVRGAAGYRFELGTGSGKLLYQAVTPDLFLQLGDTAPLFEKQRYGFWRVVPIGATGTEMVAFPTQNFQILGNLDGGG